MLTVFVQVLVPLETVATMSPSGSAALMAKMQIAEHERPVVKLECLRMIAKLQLDRARSRLISGFVDSYLKLNEIEQREFDARIERLEESHKERVMEIVTSWMEDGIRLGLELGLERGRQEGAIELVLKLLTGRIGPVDANAETNIRSLSPEKIEDLAANLYQFESLEDLQRWLSAGR